MRNNKLKHLQNILREMKSVLVAYSGGVDSAFLLRAALDVLGEENVLAVTARSQTYPEEEFEAAAELVKELGARHKVIWTDELNNSAFKQNSPDRCYYCKRELFFKLKRIASEEEIEFVADGSNADDLCDFRPGSKAAAELDVRRPLQEAGWTKDDIRFFAKEAGLSVWNKPATACLSSRFPYYSEITPNALKKIEDAEFFIHSLGIDQVRIRYYNDMVRIEVEEPDIEKFVSLRRKAVEKLKSLGFTYIALDLEGYRMGSMNKSMTNDKTFDI